MAEDPEVAQMYQEGYAEHKRMEELDLQRIEDVHERFGYFKDANRMSNKRRDPRFDLPGSVPDTEDEMFTTDFEGDDVEPENLELYKQYKIMQQKTKMEQKEID